MRRCIDLGTRNPFLTFDRPERRYLNQLLISKRRRLFKLVGSIVRRCFEVSFFFIILDKKDENNTSRAFDKYGLSLNIEKKPPTLTVGMNNIVR